MNSLDNYEERNSLFNADQDFYENIKKRKKTRMYLFCNLKKIDLI
jgi:hypothetical protein